MCRRLTLPKKGMVFGLRSVEEKFLALQLLKNNKFPESFYEVELSNPEKK
jgi:hypothetical protein